MHARRNLSSVERILAVALSITWLTGGCVALYFALTSVRWGLLVCAVLAVAYGVAWLRVARRSRLLTWRELVMPWRSAR